MSEFEKSQVATRLGLPNSVPPHLLDNLKALAVNVLQPVRDHFGQVNISSGYRSPELNKAIGGAKTSQHCFAQAADFEIAGVPNMALANWIEDNLDFDQLILEFYTPGDPNSGWVHCSYSTTNNRKKTLTALKIGKQVSYIPGIERYG